MVFDCMPDTATIVMGNSSAPVGSAHQLDGGNRVGVDFSPTKAGELMKSCFH